MAKWADLSSVALDMDKIPACRLRRKFLFDSELSGLSKFDSSMLERSTMLLMILFVFSRTLDALSQLVKGECSLKTRVRTLACIIFFPGVSTTFFAAFPVVCK